jgi:hypothetical protein
MCIVAAAALAPSAALASNSNGELCSVQNYSETIVIGSYTVGTTTAQHASRQQVASAGAFCTNMISESSWYPANKAFDAYDGQSRVCQIIDPTASTLLIVHADPSAWSYAVDDCYGLQAANPGTRIYWERS